jgi:hypothetical protein
MRLSNRDKQINIQVIWQDYANRTITFDLR